MMLITSRKSACNARSARTVNVAGANSYQGRTGFPVFDRRYRLGYKSRKLAFVDKLVEFFAAEGYIPIGSLPYTFRHFQNT